MVKELMHDPIFLAQKSMEATAEDLPIAWDLLDTLAFHRETCVGMAARMIGVWTVMLNPEIISQSDAYETEESCLSLFGGPRQTMRYRKIKVRYENEKMQTRLKTFVGFTAQIIQHEIDHCNGVLI